MRTDIYIGNYYGVYSDEVIGHEIIELLKETYRDNTVEIAWGRNKKCDKIRGTLRINAGMPFITAALHDIYDEYGTKATIQ